MGAGALWKNAEYKKDEKLALITERDEEAECFLLQTGAGEPVLREPLWSVIKKCWKDLSLKMDARVGR